MTAEQHEIIKRGYQSGLTEAQMAEEANCTVTEVEVFLTAWCSEGAPGAFE